MNKIRIATKSKISLNHIIKRCFSINFYDMPFTSSLNPTDKTNRLKAFRVMDENGKILNK